MCLLCNQVYLFLRFSYVDDQLHHAVTGAFQNCSDLVRNIFIVFCYFFRVAVHLLT